MELILIHPLGFTIDDKRVKRSGLDYWPHVRLTEYASWDAFLEARTPRADQLFLFEEFGARSFYEPDYPEDAYLVFGQETKGIPQAIIEAHARPPVQAADALRSDPLPEPRQHGCGGRLSGHAREDLSCL